MLCSLESKVILQQVSKIIVETKFMPFRVYVPR